MHASVKQMQDLIKDQALQEQDSLILNRSKMDYYKRVYDIQARAPYVDLIHFRTERSVLAKLRTSAHNLVIEKGSHNNISRLNRTWPVCSMGPVENEDHFLLECTAYRQLREDFILKLNGIGINIINTNSARASSNWYCFLNSKNAAVIKLIVKYMRSLFETRESLL